MSAQSVKKAAVAVTGINDNASFTLLGAGPAARLPFTGAIGVRHRTMSAGIMRRPIRRIISVPIPVSILVRARAGETASTPSKPYSVYVVLLNLPRAALHPVRHGN